MTQVTIEEERRDPFTWLYYVLLFTMPIGLSGIGLTSVESSIGNISISDFILIPVLLLLALRTIAGYRYSASQRHLGTRYLLFCAVFLLVPVLGLWNIVRFNTSLKTAVFSIAKLGICLMYGLVFLLYLSRCSTKEWQRFVIAAALSGVVFSLACALGVVLHFAGVKNVLAESSGATFRATGFQEDPNLAAIFQVMSMSYALAWLRFTKKKPIVYTVLAILLLGAVLTTSKAIILTMVITLAIVVVLMLFARMEKTFVRVVAVCALLLAICIVLYNTTPIFDSIAKRLEGLFSGDATTALTGRNVLWEAAFGMLENPVNFLFGVGIGHFSNVAQQYGYVQGFEGYVAHNTFISFLTECGILQFLVLAAVMIGFLWMLIRNILQKKDTFSLSAIWGLIAVFIFMNSLNFQNNRMAYVFLVFILVSQYRIKQEHSVADVSCVSAPQGENAVAEC